MKHLKVAVFAALVGAGSLASTFALAYESDPAAAREQRMNDSLQHYHDRDARADRNPSPGRMARAEESVKHGFTETGHAIKRGAHKVSHAVGTGVHKTGDALHRTGEKMEGKPG